MTQNSTGKKHGPAKDMAIDMDVADRQEISQLALSNINDEILEISTLVENSITDLSGRLQKLVHYSKRQMDAVTTMHDLLQGSDLNDGAISNDNRDEIVAETVADTAEVAAYFHQNVNRMIYIMQFQDRSRQLMLAISATLNILIKLSESSHKGQALGNIKETVTISADNKNILNQLIDDAAHKELDQNYILRMFTGLLGEENKAGSEDLADFTDIEFF